MSATAALRELVEAVVGQITGALSAKDTEQDKKLDGLDKRLTALEDQVGVPEEKVTPAKKTAAARPATAKADTSK